MEPEKTWLDVGVDPEDHISKYCVHCVNWKDSEGTPGCIVWDVHWMEWEDTPSEKHEWLRKWFIPDMEKGCRLFREKDKPKSEIFELAGLTHYHVEMLVTDEKTGERRKFVDPSKLREFLKDEQTGRTGFSDFNSCPECGKPTMFLNIGRQHWGYCEACKVKWWIGDNLFSSWRDQTEDSFRDNAKFLKDYAVFKAVESEPSDDIDFEMSF